MLLKMSKSLTIRGSVSNHGKLKILNKPVLDMWLMDNRDKQVKLELEVWKNKRSNPQNSYYWGVVVAMIKEAINEYGNEFDAQETHEFLKKEFNYKEVEVDEGHYLKVPTSTTKLDTIGFSEYIMKVQQFASEMFGVYIPDPNESDLV